MKPATLKSLLSLLSLLSLGCLLAFTTGKEPEKGDNAIIITQSFTADSSFKLCSRLLADKGYTFETRDKELGQIVTAPRSYAGAFNYKLILLFRDNSIKVKSSINMMNLAQQIVWVDWKYNNTPGDDRRQAFKKFYPDVQALSTSMAGNITYKQE